MATTLQGHFCGPMGDYQGDLPDVGNDEVPCCYGSAEDGPKGCTCWVEVYDLAQHPLTDDGFTVGPSPCADCAYRPDSPEKAGAEHVAGDAGLLDRLVEKAEPFWCHQGIRRVVALRWEPDDGREPVEHIVPEEFAVAYRPPMRDNRPYKADGTVADLCAGWAGRVAARHGIQVVPSGSLALAEHPSDPEGTSHNDRPTDASSERA